MSAAPPDPVQAISDAIVSRGLREPAIFLLELCKPLMGCMREVYTVSEPLTTSLAGSERALTVRELLSSNSAVEQLILCLERSRDRDSEGAS